MQACSINRKSASPTPSTTYSYQGKFTNVETDRLLAVYTQDEGNVLTRYNTISKSKVEYVDNRLGGVTDIDPYDPLNIVLFYKSYGIVKIMDNTLNIVKVLPFQQSSPWQNITQVCSANDGKLWIFDENQQKIFKVNHNFKAVAESNHMRDLGLNAPNVIRMREQDNQLYVLMDDVGILVFDNFGQFIRKIVTDQYDDFTLDDNKTILQSKGIERQVLQVNTTNLTKSQVALDTKSEKVKGVRKLGEQWIIWYENGVDLIN